MTQPTRNAPVQHELYWRPGKLTTIGRHDPTALILPLVNRLEQINGLLNLVCPQ